MASRVDQLMKSICPDFRNDKENVTGKVIVDSGCAIIEYFKGDPDTRGSEVINLSAPTATQLAIWTLQNTADRDAIVDLKNLVEELENR